MKLHEIVQNKEIVLVCGNIASGKGTYIKQNYPDYTQLTVSDIVKRLSKQTERSELGKTAYLDTKIIQELIVQINQHDKVVVDGIRQLSILHALETHYQQQIKRVIWLDVPEEERRNRFAGRKDTKDNMDFDTSVESDRKLGIDDVERYVRKNHTTEKY